MSSFNLIFCDINPEFLTETKQLFGDKATYFNGDIRRLAPSFAKDGTIAFVSPANSFLKYGGGIDGIYLSMFPSLGAKAKSMAEAFGGQCMIGSAALIDVGCSRFVLAAPTMIYPGSLALENDIRLSFSAVLHLAEKYNRLTGGLQTVVVPGMGTGVGGLSVTRSATAMLNAYNNYYGVRSIDLSPSPNMFVTIPDAKDIHIQGHNERTTEASTDGPS